MGEIKCLEFSNIERRYAAVTVGYKTVNTSLFLEAEWRDLWRYEAVASLRLAEAFGIWRRDGS